MEKLDFEEFQKIARYRVHKNTNFQCLYETYLVMYKHQEELGIENCYFEKPDNDFYCERYDVIIDNKQHNIEKEIICDKVGNYYSQKIVENIKKKYGIQKRCSDTKGFCYKILCILYWPKKKKEEVKQSYGIYGIYQNNELVYVGMTMRPFEKRWKEHEDCIQEGNGKLIFYSQIDKSIPREYKVITDISKEKFNIPITKQLVEAMEFQTIHLYKPKYNYAGRTVEYKFSK